MLVFAILAGLLATSKAWILTASHEIVVIGETKNVSLDCRYQASLVKKTWDSLERIRIYRTDETGRRTTVEKVSTRDKPINRNGRIVTSFFQAAGNYQDSFLNIRWPVATDDTIGRFACDVEGYDTERNFFISGIPPVTIKSQTLTLEDLLQMIEDAKTDFQKKEDLLELEINSLKKELVDMRNDNAKARQDMMEFTKQTVSKLRNESQEATSILENELANHRQINTVFRQDILELKNTTENSNLNFQKAISDLRKDLSSSITKVNFTCTAECQREILELRTESEESDAKIEQEIGKIKNDTKGKLRKQKETLEMQFQREISNISHQNDEHYKSLQREIARVGNKTIDKFNSQIQENEEKHDREVAGIKEEYTELESDLQQKLVDFTNSTQQKILEQNQGNERVFQEIYSKLKNLTAIEAERQGNENYTKLQEDFNVMRRVTNEISHKLQNEITQREREHQITNAEIEKNLSDLKKFTIQEILNQSETFHLNLKQEISDVNLLSQKKYEQLEQMISKIDIKLEEGNRNISQMFQDLKNTVTTSEDCRDGLAVLRDNILEAKNYTAKELWKLKAFVKERLVEVLSINETDIEQKAQEAFDRIRDDLMRLRNFTVTELMKQEKTDLNLTQNLILLRQDVKAKFVSKTDFTHKLSTLQNRTEIDKIEWQDQLSGLKNFTTRQIRTAVAKTENTTNMIYEMIGDTTNECKMNIADLWSNFTDIKKDLGSKIHVLEKEKNLTVSRNDEKMTRLTETINSLINAIDAKYENVTNALRTDLAEKSQCVCPTPQTPRPTEQVNTMATEMIWASSTINTENTQLSTESTLTSDGTKSTSDASLPSKSTQLPAETTISLNSTLPSTSTTMETTTYFVTDWPEGTYALLASDSGCPDSEGFIWDEGWIQFHTETDFNQDIVSPGNHFKKPIFRTDGIDNFVQLHYCLKKQTVPNATEWPKGSYCINRLNEKCPSGFRSGYIQYDEEHIHVQQRHSNPPDIESESGSLERVYYCCRKDGSAEVAIHLPTIKPFYLYRAKDVPCQTVFGMRLSVEVVQVDTNHDDNQDDFEDPDDHPYAFLHPVKHTLCHYSL